jgi:DNA mismatch repair ATPase MutS
VTPTPTLTLTRRGDFYEAHDGDAEIVARALGLVLTRSRDGRRMTGIPALRLFDADYVPALLALGHVVTIDPGVEPMPKPVPAQGELL